MASKESMKDVTTPVFVLDFCEKTGFFVHKVENGQRAEILARLLKRVFSGEDRPCPSLGGEKGLEAFRAYRTLEEIQKKDKNILVYEFDKKIPSFNKAVQALGISDKSHLSSDEQDKLFQRFHKFFTSITPVVESEAKVA